MADKNPDASPETSPEISQALTGLRESIAEVDRSLLELINRRMELAAEVGRVKIGTGQPILVPGGPQPGADPRAPARRLPVVSPKR